MNSRCCLQSSCNQASSGGVLRRLMWAGESLQGHHFGGLKQASVGVLHRGNWQMLQMRVQPQLVVEHFSAHHWLPLSKGHTPAFICLAPTSLEEEFRGPQKRVAFWKQFVYILFQRNKFVFLAFQRTLAPPSRDWFLLWSAFKILPSHSYFHDTSERRKKNKGHRVSKSLIPCSFEAHHFWTKVAIIMLI